MTADEATAAADEGAATAAVTVAAGEEEEEEEAEADEGSVLVAATSCSSFCSASCLLRRFLGIAGAISGATAAFHSECRASILGATCRVGGRRSVVVRVAAARYVYPSRPLTGSRAARRRRETSSAQNEHEPSAQLLLLRMTQVLHAALVPMHPGPGPPGAGPGPGPGPARGRQLRGGRAAPTPANKSTSPRAGASSREKKTRPNEHMQWTQRRGRGSVRLHEEIRRQNKPRTLTWGQPEQRRMLEQRQLQQRPKKKKWRQERERPCFERGESSCR